MAILSIFPGGGSTKLDVTAYASAGSLPANADEGDIAVITSMEIGDAYASADELSSPTSSDVWVKLGISSAAPIDLNDTLTVHPRGVYQYNGSVWSLLDSYVYHNSAWVQLRLLLYDAGTFYFNASFVDTSGYHRSSFTLNSTNMALRVLSDVNGPGYQYAFSTIAFDLSGISIIRITTAGTPDVRRVGVNAASGATSFSAYASIASSTQDFNVSALTGEYYIGVYAYKNKDSGEATLYVTKIEFL